MTRKITKNKRKITRNKRKITKNKRKITRNKRKITQNKRKSKKYKNNIESKKTKIYIKRRGGNKILIESMIKYNKSDDNTFTEQPYRCMCMDYEIQGNKYILNSESRCKNKATSNSSFCSKHQNCMNFLKQYLSNSEPKYNPKEWSDPTIEGSHNCYSYFLDDRKQSIQRKCKEECLKKNKGDCVEKIEECGDFKPQPGDFSYLLTNDPELKKIKRVYRCDKMHQKILSDNPDLLDVNFTQKCPTGYYKGAMVVDKDHTFHFYRQDDTGRWSHKPGTLAVSDVDADGKKIYIPHFANRNYSKHRKNEPIIYNGFCGYFCVPSNYNIGTNSS
jgi:hypothetical protein